MNTLSDRAIMVSLSMRTWTGVTADRGLAESTEEAAKAEAGTMTVIKELTPRQYLKPIKAAVRLARQEHLRMTVPGLHRGQHLLATAMFPEYTMLMGSLRDNFASCVNDFIDVYPSIIEAAPQRLGEAYRQTDFPSGESMRDFFGFDLQFSPVPKASDWRLDDLSQDDISKIKQDCQSEVEYMFNEATKEIFNRAKEVLGKFLAQAEHEDANIRKPTVENVKDMAQLVLKMNVTKDPELDRLGYEMIESFADHEAEELRNNGDLRKRIAAKTKELMTRIK